MENQGIEKFIKFTKNTTMGSSNFDCFFLLEHLTQNTMDRDLIAAIFCESKLFYQKIGNKPFEVVKGNQTINKLNL